jgi:hypothetical protein
VRLYEKKKQTWNFMKWSGSFYVSSSEIVPNCFLSRRLLDAQLSFLLNGKANTLTLGQTNKWCRSVTNHKHVVDASGECVASCVLQVHNVVASGVLLAVLDNTDAAVVVSAGDDGKIADLELSE